MEEKKKESFKDSLIDFFKPVIFLLVLMFIASVLATSLSSNYSITDSFSFFIQLVLAIPIVVIFGLIISFIFGLNDCLKYKCRNCGREFLNLLNMIILNMILLLNIDVLIVVVLIMT